jgi:hypothetical protein
MDKELNEETEPPTEETEPPTEEMETPTGQLNHRTETMKKAEQPTTLPPKEETTVSQRQPHQTSQALPQTKTQNLMIF